MSEEQTAERYELLAEKWMNGTITEAEKQEYADWYTTNQDKPIDIPAAFADSREVLQERIFQHVKDGIQRGKVVGIRRTYKWVAAAAVLLILGGAGYYAMQQTRRQVTDEQSIAIAQTVLPGTDKAILTLAGGQQIILDTTLRANAIQYATVSNGLLSYVDNNAATPAWNTLSTPRGGQYRLVLPDGTGLWLNAASSVRFPTKFTGKERRIEVKGEVYLEVKEDAEHPFFVSAGGAEVQVLGTHFNIKAYADEAEMATTLLEGSVRVKEGNDNVTLKPGEQARSAAGKRIQTIANVNTAEVVAWKDGLFQFSGSDLPAMMRQVGRWYDIDVKFEGRVPEFSFEGKLQRSLNLSQVLKVLSDMNIQYRMDGKTLTILP